MSVPRYRIPLAETDINTAGSGSLYALQRGWSQLKAFSTSIGKQYPRSVRKVPQHVPEETSEDLWKARFPLSVVVAAKSTASLSSILAQVSVGPLQSVSILQSQPTSVVILEFVSEKHVNTFRALLNGRRYIVNGHPLYERNITHDWAVKTLESAPNLLSQMNTSSCRRSLMIYRPVSISRLVSTSNRPRVLSSPEIDPFYLKKVFSRFGRILQIRPMISQYQVAFAIDYASITEAVRAKKMFQDEIERPLDMPLPIELYFKELHEWRVDFVRELTERRECYN